MAILFYFSILHYPMNIQIYFSPVQGQPYPSGWRYQRTRGSASFMNGLDYDVAVCSLVFLRAIRRTRDFFLCSNYAPAGDFDDVALFYKLQGDAKYRAVLVQIRHRERAMRNKRLMADGPFRLQPLSRSLAEIEDWPNRGITFQSRTIEVKDVSFVLYSNAGFDFAGVADDVTDQPEVAHLRELLDTGGRLLRISEPEQMGIPGRLASCLTLCTEQVSVRQADNLLERELADLLQLGESMSPGIATELQTSLVEGVRRWWSGRGPARCLTARAKEWTNILRRLASNYVQLSAVQDQGGPQGQDVEAVYQKTLGCPSFKGLDYEVAVCSLVFLRVLRRTTDFFLCCNYAPAGYFDDVALFYKLQGDSKYRAVLVQVKHRERTMRNERLTANRPFHLQTLSHSFAEIEDWPNREIPFPGEAIEVRDVSFVLYSNAGFDFAGVADDVTDQPEVAHLRELLDTGGRMLQFSEPEQLGIPRGLAGRLTLCTEQVSVHQADELLERELADLLQLTSAEVARELKSRLVSRVRRWWSDVGPGRCLTAHSKEWTDVVGNLNLGSPTQASDVPAEPGHTELMEAVHQGQQDEVERLLLRGANPNESDRHGGTALMIGAQRNRPEIVRLLLANGAEPDIQDKTRKVTALFLACVGGHRELVEVLLDNGANPNIQNIYGDTAFMAAAFGGHLELVKILLRKCNLDLQNNLQFTALILAAAGGHLGVVELLLDKGANPEIRNKYGDTAFMSAANYGHLDLVEALLRKSPDLNSQNNNGFTALMLAAIGGHLGVVQLLLNKRADPNLKNIHGNTALISAAHQGHAEVVRVLLREGVQPNMQNNDGYTALMLAADEGHLKVVKALLHSGADRKLRNNGGFTALDLAAYSNHLNVLELLQNY